ncbi:MAG: NPCBM/NEW2 domain-containing protein, partial [Planctomycetaceae bacterium]
MNQRALQRELPIKVFLLLMVVSVSVAIAGDAQRENRQWVAAKFGGRVASRPAVGQLAVTFKSGRLLKNMATTKVYHTQIGALPLKIADRQYQRGLYCPSAGKIVVRLPGPAKCFEAVFGVDSNRVDSFYSNAGRGRVVGTVQVHGAESFRTKVLREGMPGVQVRVELAGAREFTLAIHDAGGGIVERVDFNQADWAEARVEMQNGDSVWLADLPVGPLRALPVADPPFSFVYNGENSRDVLQAWGRRQATRELDDKRREHTLEFVDGATGLRVRCVGIEYRDFPVVEWKLFFKNTSDRPTPIIENILALDTRIERDNEGEFILHHSNGSPHSLVKMSDPTDYAPRVTRLGPQIEKQLGSKIGLPASQDLPFFNIESNGRGVIVAIGWPGQWSATLTRDKQRGLSLRAGQERTHFKLLPGEEVRSPMIAMMSWDGGDWIGAQNLWRRWMIAHNLPRTNDGQLPPPQHSASSSAQFVESSGATEQNQLMFIDRYLEERMPPDYWWIDAGWYDYRDYWLNVGTWRPHARRFPGGLRPIADHLHQNKMKLILWFTPECVTR